jgi:hypothetical protein
VGADNEPELIRAPCSMIRLLFRFFDAHPLETVHNRLGFVLDSRRRRKSKANFLTDEWNALRRPICPQMGLDGAIIDAFGSNLAWSRYFKTSSLIRLTIRPAIDKTAHQSQPPIPIDPRYTKWFLTDLRSSSCTQHLNKILSTHIYFYLLYLFYLFYKFFCALQAFGFLVTAVLT